MPDDLLIAPDAMQRLLHERWVALYADQRPRIDLFHGDVLVPPPPAAAAALRELADRAAAPGRGGPDDLELHRYRSPHLVAPALATATAGWLRRDGIPVVNETREVIVGVGVTQLTVALLHEFARAGRTVLFPLPTYTYPLLAAPQAGHPVRLLRPTGAHAGHRWDLERIRRAVETWPDIGAIFLVNPGNPSGEVLSAEFLRGLARLVLDHPDLVVIADEIYREMILDGSPFTAAAAVSDAGRAMYARTITLRGLAKCYGLAKLRIGVAAAAEELLDRFSLRSFVWFNTAAPSEIDQLVAAAVLDRTPESYHRSTVRAYRRLFRLVRAEVDRINRAVGVEAVQVVPSAAGSFALLRLTGFRGRTGPDAATAYHSDAQIAADLHDRGVALVPGSAFGYPQEELLLRLTVTSPEADLRAGLALLGELTREVVAAPRVPAAP
ncbi:pyridoxal phosphate-dependent aminotransferase [Plantactinospora siamensis]|uniref:Pyridoxal phosphate-dependent aminotransferase n=1 Tax=Plantactinospora siamensis TaxID=555372 RepID=A0ABV6P5Y8_9ACTN